jgi:chromosome segregation ATPase
MTAEWNADEAKRLAATLRLVIAAGIPGVAVHNGLFDESGGEKVDSAAFAAIADQLEAAAVEIERLTAERDRVVAHGHGALAERDDLKAEVERLRIRQDVLDDSDSELIAKVVAWHHLTAENASLRQQLADANSDLASFAGEVADALGTPGADLTAVLVGGVRSLRQQLEAARIEILALSNANRSLGPDAMLTAVDIECTRAERDGARRDLAAAQQRIAELEIALALGKQDMNECAQLTAALRAIAPVYRAACDWVPDRHSRYSPCASILREAVDDARAALTPDLLAVIDSACKETA